LLLFKIISFEVAFGFEVPKAAVYYTFILFTGIFTVNLLYNLFQVYRSKPIELLQGGKVGEKEPKTKWLLVVVGTISLAIGYYIALTTESPLAALSKFFLAVILVIVGTYCLFTAGSIALLKILRKNKSYYYKAKNFISISGMIYRMKQNAVGLANICILATTVIFLISTTVSMYVGVDDALKTRYPREITVNGVGISDEDAGKLNSVIKEEIKKVKVNEKNTIHYRPMTFSLKQNGNKFSSSQGLPVYELDSFAMVTFITLDDYNKMVKDSESLSNNEALLYTVHGDLSGDSLNFNGHKITVKKRLSSLDIDGEMTAILRNTYYLVVNNADTIHEVYKALEGKDNPMGDLSYFYGFDIDGDKDLEIKLTSALQKALKELNIDVRLEGRESLREGFYSLYGVLFFLGIFLGLLFIMATVLIIYYKQIAEGYDDKERFEIMQKVGMSHNEVKKVISSQVLTVFFLPLVAAVIHIAFAFKVITKLLSLFNLTNIPLFAVCTAITILIFAIFYALVYSLTARTYYRIVSK
jgi:putative ABC transport system permease protein